MNWSLGNMESCTWGKNSGCLCSTAVSLKTLKLIFLIMWLNFHINNRENSFSNTFWTHFFFLFINLGFHCKFWSWPRYHNCKVFREQHFITAEHTIWGIDNFSSLPLVVQLLAGHLAAYRDWLISHHVKMAGAS